MWRQVAYIAKYGRQPLSEIFRLTSHDAESFVLALSSIIEEESKG